jgi:ubiquinone/menaquinone biosynthesis C-methylase UbiE
MYVCSRCKGPLLDYRCANCQLEFSVIEGIPCFLTDTAGASNQKLREIYDDIYDHHVDAWVGQGREEAFLKYIGSLAQIPANGDVLEIGCGEGMQLAALPGGSKHGIDPSVRALLRARRRSAAQCAVARAESLPFAEASFDLVVTVGVMEHFEDPDAASAEINRVLKPAGQYICLIQTDMTRLQRAAVKMREYVYPRFRPLAALKWATSKVRHPIVQPMRKSYTVATAQQCLERNGLAVTQIITRRNQPNAPLTGDHVVILLARKR